MRDKLYLCRNFSEKCRGLIHEEGGIIAGFYSNNKLTVMYV